jgi:hypothetical protein
MTVITQTLASGNVLTVDTVTTFGDVFIVCILLLLAAVINLNLISQLVKKDV